MSLPDELAQEQCSDCHAVDQPTQASQKAPSLTAIANMRSTTSMSLHVFLQTPHYKMPNYRLTSQEIDDVVAYILSLHGHGTQESGATRWYAGSGNRPYRSAVGGQKMAEFRVHRSDCERMLHLRARTFAPNTRQRPTEAAKV